MSTDYILEIIREYAEEQFSKELRCHLRRKYFEQRSYQMWAVNEILGYIEKSEYPPIIALEIFIDETSSFSCRNPKTKNIFLIAHSVATEIFDMLSAMEMQ